MMVISRGSCGVESVSADWSLLILWGSRIGVLSFSVPVIPTATQACACVKRGFGKRGGARPLRSRRGKCVTVTEEERMELVQSTTSSVERVRQTSPGRCMYVRVVD